MCAASTQTYNQSGAHKFPSGHLRRSPKQLTHYYCYYYCYCCYYYYHYDYDYDYDYYYYYYYYY